MTKKTQDILFPLSLGQGGFQNEKPKSDGGIGVVG